MKLVRVVAAGGFVVVAIAGWSRAQGSDDRPGPYTFTVLDLKYEVVDLGGKVQDMSVRETETEVHIELAADVLFDFDKADLRPEAQVALKQAADIIREKGGKAVEVDGYTDSKGADAYNRGLSQRRAESVRNWLVAKEGLNDRKFVVRGFGAKNPVAPNTRSDGSDDPDGRQKNRRVEIVVKKKA